MSGEAIAWAVREQTPSLGCKLLLLLLAYHANDEHTGSPSLGVLQRDAGMTDRGVQKCLAQLAEAGLVTIQRRACPDRRTATNMFRLVIRPGHSPAAVPATPNAIRPPSNAVLHPPNSVPPAGPNVVRPQPELNSSWPSPAPSHATPRGNGPSARGGTRRRRQQHDDPAFAAFWAAYPRPVAKDDARRAWSKAVAGGAAKEEIMAGLATYRFDLRENGRFIPYPATWLNGGRWKDGPAPSTGGLADRFLARYRSGDGSAGGGPVIDGQTALEFPP